MIRVSSPRKEGATPPATYKDMPPNVLSLVKTLEGGGGGFYCCQERGGRYSNITWTITFMLGCRSHPAWGCPHKVCTTPPLPPLHAENI